MKRRTLISLSVLMLAATAAYGHELFIKLDSYFLGPGAKLRVSLLNGTFDESLGPVKADRVLDVRLAGPNGSTRLSLDGWSAEGDTTFFPLEVGGAGTYVLGVSTRPRLIELEAKDFNEYLAAEGLPDVLEERRRTGREAEDAVERYSKHVKAVLQVGRGSRSGWERPLGFPAEIIPLSHPYAVEVGGQLAFRALVHGKPVENLVVMAGGEGGEGSFGPTEARTDSVGVVRFTIDRPGKWYVKFIHMVETSEERVNYESNWATLTFGVRD